jgi:hypothetical protein
MAVLRNCYPLKNIPPARADPLLKNTAAAGENCVSVFRCVVSEFKLHILAPLRLYAPPSPVRLSALELARLSPRRISLVVAPRAARRARGGASNHTRTGPLGPPYSLHTGHQIVRIGCIISRTVLSVHQTSY